MKLILTRQGNSSKYEMPFSFALKSISAYASAAFLMIALLTSMQTIAQGTWTKIATPAPDPNGGVMLLMTDGTIICKTFSGGTDGIGNIWDKLTPDIHGSYVNGTWTRIKAMNNTRLYFSSQVLKDGRVYVCGGEYGSGGYSGEVYNPLTNTWTATPSQSYFVSDANSAILEDGRVLQAIVQGNPFLKQNKIYNPASNTYIAAPSCIGYHNESTWLKLRDNSILMVDRDTRNSERYIQATNTWIADGTLPVDLYDIYGSETGAAVLLPDGRAWFVGSTGHTAYYTPSGSSAAGTWVAGPDVPSGKGQPDAPAAMMINGKVLLSVSPKASAAGVFRTPTTFYEFDPLTNVYTSLTTPGGGASANIPVYQNMMLDLPDGTVLTTYQDSTNYYIYTPVGVLPRSYRPKISSVTKNTTDNAYTLIGTLLNGITEGAIYGDDFQMNTNYPIVRLTAGTNVYYARTYNWNSTGVYRKGLTDTVQFELPAGLPQQTYQLVVSANGLASKAVSFIPSAAFAQTTSVEDNVGAVQYTKLKIYPNPVHGEANIQFSIAKSAQVSIKLYDVNGKDMKTIISSTLTAGDHSLQFNTNGLPAGVYYLKLVTPDKTENIKLVVQ